MKNKYIKFLFNLNNLLILIFNFIYIYMYLYCAYVYSSRLYIRHRYTNIANYILTVIYQI